jgi:Flp pilus assembly protein TadG
MNSARITRAVANRHTAMQKWKSLPTFSQRPLRRLRQERGQALVEFAIILPVLLLIIGGIVYFGRYENYSNQVTQLAEQAARYASVNSSVGAGTLQAYIQAQAPIELQTQSGDVTKKVAVWVGCLPAACVPNNSAVTACVTATVSYPSILGALGTSTLVGKATMLTAVTPSSTSWVSSGTSPPC